MKTKLLPILRVAVVLAIAVFAIFKLWNAGVFLPDDTAEISLNRAVWNQRTYSDVSGVYTEGKTIAKGSSDWVLNAVKEDPTHTFVAARSFLDNALLVADDYTIPTAGDLTTVSWNGTYITDEAFLSAMTAIDAEKTTSFSYETDGIYQLTDQQQMRELYFAFEDCPVTTICKGYMGKVGGKWMITTEISSDTRNEDGSPKPHTVSCYEIPAQYWEILSAYFS